METATHAEPVQPADRKVSVAWEHLRRVLWSGAYGLSFVVTAFVLSVVPIIAYFCLVLFGLVFFGDPGGYLNFILVPVCSIAMGIVASAGIHVTTLAIHAVPSRWKLALLGLGVVGGAALLAFGLLALPESLPNLIVGLLLLGYLLPGIVISAAIIGSGWLLEILAALCGRLMARLIGFVVVPAPSDAAIRRVDSRVRIG